jgi:carboxyl-terminal processing protease
MSQRPNRERWVWAAVTVVLLAALGVFVFSPRLLAAGPDEETRQYMSDFADVFRFVRDNYVDGDKAKPKALVEGALKGMFDALGDPYSAYLNSDQMRDVDDVTTGRFSGVGLIISKVDKGAEVVSPIEGTPAYKAGINAGDIITKVNGEAMADYTIDEIMKRIRGEPQTEVTLSLLRGDSVVFDLTVRREVIENPAVRYAMIGDDVGYVRIVQFTPQVADRVRDAVNTFKAAGYRYMVVDVRSDPGGLLNSAIDTANLFLSDGPIVGTRSDRVESENRVYYAKRSRMVVDPKIPVAVLVDKGSASASEILSGALKDTDRAMLFGSTTYGKGSVQQVQRMEDTGGAFRLTMSRYYTPSGAIIDKKGIEPDRRVEEPKLTPEEEKSLTEVLSGKVIRDFVKANSQPSETQLTAFTTGLHKKGIVLNDRYLRRLVRDELNRTNNNPPIFDLDFDIVLQAAVKALRDGEVKGK